MPTEELRKRLGYDPRGFARVERRLIDEEVIAEDGPRVQIPGFKVLLSAEEQRIADAVAAELAGTGASPPSRADLKARHAVSDEIIQAMVDQGRVVEVGPELIYPAADYQEVVGKILDLLKASGKITVAEVRDAFSTSRKYALALLEHLDERKVTKRVGDERVLV